MKTFILLFKFSLIWALLILIACTCRVQTDSGIDIDIPFLDKIVHFGMYLILGALVTYEFRYITKYYFKYLVKILIICVLYGIFIEVIQYFLPWRGFEFADMIADGLGAAAGIYGIKCLIFDKIVEKKN